MNFKQCLIIALPALLCGALLGYLAAPTPEANEVEPEVKEVRSETRAPRVPSDEAALDRLRSRIRDLERQLAARNGEQENETPVNVQTNRVAENRENRGGFESRMEEWRKNNPQQYAEMTNRFARMRQDHIQRVQGRLNLLASVDVSQLNPKQREVHARYQELLAQQTELRDAMRPGSGSDMTDEQRNQAWQQLRNIDNQVRHLADAERNTLLAHTALQYGIKGAQAKEAVETIKAVFQATESDWGGPRGGPGGRGGGGGRGGRGRH